ncbi:hypothetical protein D3C77_328810 [compost metagenome]
MPFDHFALAHIQNLHTHPAFINRIPEYVAILGIGHRYFLLLHQRVDVHNLIAKLLGPLEIQFLGRFMHFALQLFLDLFMSATQKRMDLLRNFIVRCLRHFLDTGRQALAHVIVQAYLLGHHVALTQWIHPVKQLLRLLGCISVRVGTEVLCFIL